MNDLGEEIVKAFFAEYGMVRHHIDSFNRFMEKGMQVVVDETGELLPAIIPQGAKEYRIKFGKIAIGNPVVKEADGSMNKIYPSEARVRQITYEAPITLELFVEQDGVRKDPVLTEIGSLPIMLKSSPCYLSKLSPRDLVENGEDPSDPGGYFVINGTERVLIAIEDLGPNTPLLETKKSGPVTHAARLFSEAPGIRIPHLFERLHDGTVRVSFGRISKLPVGVLQMALGLESDEEIGNAISENEELAEDVMVNLETIEECKTIEDALDWIGRQLKIGQGKEYRVQRVQELIDQYLLPHIGRAPGARREKAIYLGKVTERLIKLHYGLLKDDDKDHYSNKRLKLAGELMEQLFRAAFKAMVNDMKYSFERITKRGREPPIETIVRSQLLTGRLQSALATGYWVGSRTGVSQHLQRLNYLDTLSHLRRVLSPLTTSQPHFEARELHPTHWGKLCASETPEGQNIGLRKNLALIARVTHGSDDEPIRKFLFSAGVEPAIREGSK
ncbi:MAG: DNA-directed RNA polymerase subunit B'' [archaeon]